MELNGDQKLFGDQIFISGWTIPVRTLLTFFLKIFINQALDEQLSKSNTLATTISTILH